MTDYATMNKTQLRAACKEAGISYGNLDNDGMRAALTGVVTHTDEQPVPIRVKVESNGIIRPRAGGKLDAVWTALDGMLAETGKAPTLKEAKAVAAERGWAAGTVNVQYYRWRTYTAA